MPSSIYSSGASIRLSGMISGPGPGEAQSKQHDSDEVDLVTRLRARDETAFREIVDRYTSRIYRVSYGILGNRDAADEIAQKVFTKVYFSIQDFGGRGPLYAWLHRIAINECYGLLRKKRFKMAYSSESSDGAEALRMEGLANECTTPDRTATKRRLLNELLTRVPEDDRWLLISKDAEGFSLDELSQITGLNENTIKIRLFRVRQGLVAAAARL